MEMWSTLRNFPLDLFINSRVGYYCFCNQPEVGGEFLLLAFPSPLAMFRLKHLAPTLANHTRGPSLPKRFPALTANYTGLF